MPKFEITTPDGKRWEVESPDVETANKDLTKFRQESLNQEYVKSADAAPEWAKPFMAAQDIVVPVADTLTSGFGTKAVKKVFGGEPEMNVEAMRNRSGWAGTAADVAAMARFLPSAVNRSVAYIGGGPAARRIVGTTVAGGEGALVGGLEAAGHDKPLHEGAAVGGIAGAAGHQVSGILDKGYKWFKGIDDSVPQGIRSKIMPANLENIKNPSPVDKVTATVNEAKSKAGILDNPLAEQEKLKSAFEKILREDPKSFTKEQQNMMRKITTDEPGTWLSRYGSRALGNKVAMGAAGIGGAFAQSIPAAIGIPAALATGSRALAGVSAGGTEEALRDLQRAMAKRAKYKGILSPEQGSQITKGARQLGLEEYLYD